MRSSHDHHHHHHHHHHQQQQQQQHLYLPKSTLLLAWLLTQLPKIGSVRAQSQAVGKPDLGEGLEWGWTAKFSPHTALVIHATGRQEPSKNNGGMPLKGLANRRRLNLQRICCSLVSGLKGELSPHSRIGFLTYHKASLRKLRYS